MFRAHDEEYDVVERMILQQCGCLTRKDGNSEFRGFNYLNKLEGHDMNKVYWKSILIPREGLAEWQKEMDLQVLLLLLVAKPHIYVL
ncbi:hypothetical protein M8C21_017135, partial [Ambrosia artemisiifolia]